MSPLELEELSLSEWPALETQFLDGWILRFSRGYTKRSNSISPLYGTTGDLSGLEKKVRTCEDLYRRQDLPTIFKLTDDSDSRLDPLLDSLGYKIVDPSFVMVRDLPWGRATEPGFGEHRVEVLSRSHEEWLAWFAEEKALSTTEAGVFRHLASGGAGDAFHVRLRSPEGFPVSGATGVVNRGWLGILNVFTLNAHRRQGYSRIMLHQLLDYGADKGASRAYLSVIQSNAPAVNLYLSLGFKPLYTYWYRALKK